MAVFMLNVCKFDSCGRTFPSLGDLIFHIEDTHIDYDPSVVEQKEASQPSCIPLSYVLRFYTESSKSPIINSDVRRKLASIVKPSSVRSNTPTGSEFDEEEAYSGQSEDSNDSWTTAEEFSSEFILRYGTKMNNAAIPGQNNGTCEKPFACPVPGCKKRYKNVNGIKYHSKNGHKKDGKVRKAYKCHCGKSYKMSQGLKNHSIAQHFSQPPSPASTSMPSVTPQTLKPLSLPVMKALQGFVGSSQNNLSVNNGNNQIRQAVQITDPVFLNNKAIRAVLENGNKLPKEIFPAAATLTLPRNSIGNLQINIPNVNNAANCIPIHHSNFETDSSNFDVKPSQSPATKANISSHGGLFDNNISLNSNLGILTPASSPISSASEKIVRLSKEDNLNTPNRIGKFSSHQVNAMPLTPLTPGDSPNHFTIPNNTINH